MPVYMPLRRGTTWRRPCRLQVNSSQHGQTFRHSFHTTVPTHGGRFSEYFASIDRLRGAFSSPRSTVAEAPQQSPTGGLPHRVKQAPTPSPPQVERRRIAGVGSVIAVASGKGGVGKSTTSVNVAMAMALRGRRVGVLDADVFGPSLPRMMNLRGLRPDTTERGMLKPLQNYGIKCMSMGFLVREEDAVVWRGLMVMKALHQLLFQVDWGELDVLVIDMPPGTGDTQLTIGQQLKLDGAVIVSTPQDIALADARKGITMFQKVDVPILGVIENMSYYRCPQCSHEAHLFGNGGARAIASELGMDFLGGVPLALKIRETSDAGVPVAVAMRDSGVLGDMQEGGKGAPVDLCENGASVERSADDHSHDGRPSVDRAYADIADRILAKLDMTRQAGEHIEEREVETPRNSEQRQSS